MKTHVIAQFSLEGFHHYPEPPKGVDFLQHNHRHTFIIRTGHRVIDHNREKEIFICRDELKSYLIDAYGYPCQFNAMSCEMIANEVLDFAKDDGVEWVEVWEEETGGARVEL